MNVYWHDYTGNTKDLPLLEAGLTEKSILVGRIGLMLLSCGTGAWRVRGSMNTIAGQLGLTCTITVGLMSLDYTSYDGKKSNSQSLSLGNTGVNTSKLNQLERFVKNFSKEGVHMTLEEVHSRLDEIDKIQGLYTPAMLGLASALACGAFTFLLGGGLIEMICAFIGAGVGNYLRCKLIQKRFTLFLCISSSVALACLAYVAALRLAEMLCSFSVSH